GEVRSAAAALRLAQDDPCAATAAPGPALDGPVPANRRTWPTTGSVGARSASALGVQARPALSAWRFRMSGCRCADPGRWLPPPAGSVGSRRSPPDRTGPPRAAAGPGPPVWPAPVVDAATLAGRSAGPGPRPRLAAAPPVPGRRLRMPAEHTRTDTGSRMECC